MNKTTELGGAVVPLVTPITADGQLDFAALDRLIEFQIDGGVDGLLLPHVVRFNAPAATERYAAVALALCVQPAGSAAATAECGVGFLARLSRQCGVPQTLSEIKIPLDAIPSLAQAAMQVTRLLKNNLRPVTQADAVAIYAAAF